MTSYCLNSVHRLCQVIWHSGLLAQLKEHIIVGFVAFQNGRAIFNVTNKVRIAREKFSFK